MFDNEQKIENLTEKLAEIEHNQWMEWSKAIVHSENISEERKERWKKLSIPYKDLTEEQKEQDRVYARKVLDVLKIITGIKNAE